MAEGASTPSSQGDPYEFLEVVLTDMTEKILPNYTTRSFKSDLPTLQAELAQLANKALADLPKDKELTSILGKMTITASALFKLYLSREETLRTSHQLDVDQFKQALGQRDLLLKQAQDKVSHLETQLQASESQDHEEIIRLKRENELLNRDLKDREEDLTTARRKIIAMTDENETGHRLLENALRDIRSWKAKAQTYSRYQTEYMEKITDMEKRLTATEDHSVPR